MTAAIPLEAVAVGTGTDTDTDTARGQDGYRGTLVTHGESGVHNRPLHP